MNDDERRALWIGALVLLLASVARFGWEARPIPPLFAPDTTVYATLVPATEAAVADEARRRTPLAPGERLDPNRADEVELARLPGVGPALARRLVQAREERGWLVAPEVLLQVPGVGPATLERLRPHLAFTPPPPGVVIRDPVAEQEAPDLFQGGPARIAVNRAGVSELEALPGVGPALARRIEEDRRLHGPYAGPDDLLRVPGVGPALLERLRPWIEVP
jgi:competence protein ComEA